MFRAIALILSLCVFYERAVASQDILLSEAEQELTELDCQITDLVIDVTRMQNELGPLTFQQAIRLQMRDDFIESHLSKYREDLGADILSGIKDIDITAVSRRISENFAKKIDVISSGIDVWLGVVEKVTSTQALAGMEGDIARERARFLEIRERINAASGAVRSVEGLRATTAKKWLTRGVQFTKKYYGSPSDCKAGNGVFDGVWSFQDSGQVAFEIRGHKYSLPENQVEWHDSTPCKLSNHELTYTSPTEASISYQFVCHNGGGVYSTDRIKFGWNGYTGAMCRGPSPNPTCTEESGYYDAPITKVGE